MSLTRDYFASATGIVGLVLTILGIVFVAVGSAFALGALASAGASVPPSATSALFGIAGLFLLVGAGAGGAGILLGARRVSIVRRLARLREHGQLTEATIVDVRQDYRVRVNRRYPWRVTYRYRVGSVEHEASDRVWERPASLVQGATVAVVYDRDDPSRSVLKAS
jgi:hypothetical protein